MDYALTMTDEDCAVPQISNYTYDELTIGQTATYSKRIEETDVKLFAAVSGDVNPVHLDAEFAAQSQFGERIAHGMLTGAIISAALAMEMPGPGTIYLGQSLSFTLPVKLGDTVTVHLEVTEKKDKRRFVSLACRAVNQNDEVVAQGDALVMVPAEKIQVDAPPLPQVSLAN